MSKIDSKSITLTAFEVLIFPCSNRKRALTTISATTARHACPRTLEWPPLTFLRLSAPANMFFLCVKNTNLYTIIASDQPSFVLNIANLYRQDYILNEVVSLVGQCRISFIYEDRTTTWVSRMTRTGWILQRLGCWGLLYTASWKETVNNGSHSPLTQKGLSNSLTFLLFLMDKWLLEKLSTGHRMFLTDYSPPGYLGINIVCHLKHNELSK